jgi:phage replication-related protein YjqB (UPF0714/DUF867 family)
LAARFKEGRDFEVITRQGTGDAVILAIHGGRIEPGTAEIASGVAGADHGLYLFKGICPRDNAALHVSSTRFDDPRALALVAGARRVVSIHGCRGEGDFLVIGGRDGEGRSHLMTALPEAGFGIDSQAPPHIRGRHRDNICNRGLGGRGVQVEISLGLRKRILGEPRGMLADFCHIIREAL